MRATILGLSAALLLTAAPSAASAEEVTVRIPVYQADLESDAALANLYERVEAAASHICLETSDAFDRASRSQISCRRDAVRRAIDTANLPALSAYHAEAQNRQAATATPVLASR